MSNQSTARKTGCNALDDFVAKLRRKMQKSNINVRELADQAGVGYPYLYRVLKGEQNPTIDWMEKVGQVVGLTIKVTVK